MDKVIKKQTKYKIILMIVIMSSFVIGLKVILSKYEPSYNIKKSEVITSLVTEKEISKSIMTTGLIESLNKVLLESKESGIVTEVVVKSGTFVEVGQPILKISNENLNIEYFDLMEELERQKKSINIFKNEISSSNIDNKEQLLELDYNIELLKNNVDSSNLLLNSGRISQKELYSKKREYNFWLQKKNLFIEKEIREKKLQETKLEYSYLEIDSIKRKIDNIFKRIESLIIKAPYSGIINLENFDVGQNINNREKVGFIHRQDGFKVTSEIDEFYIDNLHLGVKAIFDEYELELIFISPEVNNKKVKLEFKFVSNFPENIKSGQSFNLKIIPNKPEMKLVIEAGSFINDTGGSWIYKIKGSEANRVPIKLGIKNSEYDEVIEGLQLGDQVIISSYKKFKEYKVIKLEE